MNSVFIADDESLVIKSLIHSVNWKRFGFEVIGEACNGIEAYEKIMELQPDLVFTDIRMPGLSGLELIKKVNDSQPDTRFVVMSGYAEFVYVQKALSYGALGYCLKPFDDAEIEGVLKKAAGIIKSNRRSFELEMLAVIDDTSEYGRMRRRELIRHMSFDWKDGEGVYLIVNQGMPFLQSDAAMNVNSFKIGKNRYARLVHESNINEFIEKYPDESLDVLGAAGVSGGMHSPDELGRAVEEACIAVNHCFITGKSSIYRYVDHEKDAVQDCIIKLRKCISLGETAESVKLLDALSTLFQNGSGNVIQAYQIYSVVMYSNKSLSNFDSLPYNYEQLLGMFRNVKEMLAYLKTEVRQADKAAQSMIADIRNETMRSILEYVNDYFSKDISIQSISKKFNVNPCYLSQLFRKETGTTFTDYITDLRIKHACNLLKTTGIAVSEVSEKAGFSDYYYFTRVFKKVVGNTPTQYRGGLAE